MTVTTMTDMRPPQRPSTRKLVMLPLPGNGLAQDAAPLRSTARMVGDQWVITSHTTPAVTTSGSWLESVVRQHRLDVGADTAVLEIEYTPVPTKLQRQLAQLRRDDEQIRKLRWALKQREHNRAGKRAALVRALTALELLPSEIAEMMALPLSTIVREAGSETEARIARSLFRHARTRDAAAQGSA